jgi:hypothetical protein
MTTLTPEQHTLVSDLQRAIRKFVNAPKIVLEFAI